jgi:hypothetical protein
MGENSGGGERTQFRNEAELREFFESIDLPQKLVEKSFAELKSLQTLCLNSVRLGRIERIGWAPHPSGKKLPILALTFGLDDPTSPILIISGGVHGLERIGSQVTLSLLNLLTSLLLWDKLTQNALERIRVAFIPIVNPWGVLERTRSNPFGVDLMRNAPIEAENNKATPWIGGQRFSPKIPWYRGPKGAPMQAEAQALVDFVKSSSFASKTVISLDLHSGFGTTDQIWFPYAGSLRPFEHLPELHAFKESFENSHPNHFYKIEPQAKNYTTHGDLWDYLYREYLKLHPIEGSVYLPLAVEMGSWLWVKKNPTQLFSALGPFNPVKPHRLRRILRRHNTLFDFILRALVSPNVWIPSEAPQRERHKQKALDLWYG